MAPVPKIPDEKNLPADQHASATDEFSHPAFHLDHEYLASTDDGSTCSSDEDDQQQQQHSSADHSNGYCLLAQDSNRSSAERHQQTENEQDENDDPFRRFVIHRIRTSIDEIRTHSSFTCDSTESVWSSDFSSESLPVDDKKADYIKSLMLSIKLPESSVPGWARSFSEQEWQEKLRQRILCQQTTFFRREKDLN